MCSCPITQNNGREGEKERRERESEITNHFSYSCDQHRNKLHRGSDQQYEPVNKLPKVAWASSILLTKLGGANSGAPRAKNPGGQVGQQVAAKPQGHWNRFCPNQLSLYACTYVGPHKLEAYCSSNNSAYKPMSVKRQANKFTSSSTTRHYVRFM